MSETKDTEPSAEAPATSGESDAPEAAPSESETSTPAGPGEQPEAAAGEGSAAEQAEEGQGSTPAEAAPRKAGPGATPKKKKKARESSSAESIADRNARVRAEAAQKRRARREREQGSAPRRNLDAGEMVDDALARTTHAAANFVTKNFNVVQWVVMVALAGWIAWEVYSWRHGRTTEKATDALFKALAAQRGKVGSGDVDMGDDRGRPSDSRRVFATDDQRLQAAKKEYLLAETNAAEGTEVLAQLGEATVAYDQGKYPEAQAAFEKVEQHPAFATNSDIKGRTLEGLGMTLEAQKKTDDAIKAFRQLSNMDSASFSALGYYHQARLQNAQGKKDEALKLLDKAGEKLILLKDTPALISFVGKQVLELLEQLDPKKANELSSKLVSADALKRQAEAASGAGAGQKLSPELQRRLQELLKKHQGQPAPMPGPVSPASSAPAAPTTPAAPPAPAPAPAPSGAP